MGLLGPLFFDNRSEVKAARIIAQYNEASAKEHNETLKAISEAWIKARDRVDISRDEYKQMKNELEHLRLQNSHMNKMIIRMGIPDEVIDAINLSTVEVFTTYDPMSTRTGYNVRFYSDMEVK
jgi:cytidylate kinase